MVYTAKQPNLRQYYFRKNECYACILLLLLRFGKVVNFSEDYTVDFKFRMEILVGESDIICCFLPSEAKCRLSRSSCSFTSASCSYVVHIK